jgi:FkbM family methyltransferase
MTFIFKLLLSIYQKADKQHRKVIRLFLEFSRRGLIFIGDPSYSLKIREKQMILPVSHKLPIYIIDYPLYDTLPARVADYIRIRDGVLSMVDVGANIGDTIVACSRALHTDRFLGVEANPEFVRYLKQNTRDLQGFSLVEAFCQSGEGKHVYVRIESSGGTARLLEASSGVAIPKKTLDEIIVENAEFMNFNFLKLDTDGNDFDILIGAKKSISVSLPIILMECDVFGNVDYVDDVMAAIDSVAKLGYSTAIVYDNFGNYFCTFPVSSPFLFLDAMSYQIISESIYFDILFLCEKDAPFIQSEKEFFLRNVEQKGLSAALQKAFRV